MEQKIYHYTSIDTLALILRGKKIMFNCLNKVCDREEDSIVPDGIKIGRYAIVSCRIEDRQLIVSQEELKGIDDEKVDTFGKRFSFLLMLMRI